MNAVAPTLDLAPSLIALPGGRASVCDGEGARALSAREARELATNAPVVVVHAALTARRLDLATPPRSPHIFDTLELFAFVRPATFCAPSAVGLALALGWPEPKGALAQAQVLRQACAALLVEIGQNPAPSREEALALAETLGRSGWSWAGAVTRAGQALRCTASGAQLDRRARRRRR